MLNDDAGERLQLTNQFCADELAQAEHQCQLVWNEVHENRSTTVDVGAAMAKATMKCRQIRSEAKSRCDRVRRELQHFKN